jgi:mono/diheme cytochrome c family protein
MACKSLLLIPLVLLIAACGTVATPVFEEQLEETRVAQAVTSEAETAAAPTATATTIPSETPLPTDTPAPTSTPVPATSTPEPATNTPEPTEAPTEQPAAAPAGNPANGQVLFNTFEAAANFACSTCHRVDSEEQLIGPGLLNVSVRAETRVPGQTAEEYIRNSILHPSDFVVENYPDMLMPQVYSTVFTEDEINDLIAYLFTLKS